jgi:histidinol phosphatase-like PHP family hydrolase
MDTIRLVVLSDLHWSSDPAHVCAVPERKSELGLELLKRVLRRATVKGGTTALILLGDLVDDGNAPSAEADLRALARAVEKTGIPFVAVPGNHDGSPARYLAIFGDRPGPHVVGPYCLYSFADAYGDGDVCSRDPQDLERLRAYAAAHPEQAIITLQHNPIRPAIQSDYPYCLRNADVVSKAYEDARVVLSISGHYHNGQPLSAANGISYLTSPAVSESPFRYDTLLVSGHHIEVAEESLRPPAATPLCDVHIHTEFAYCGSGITAEAAIERARLFGLKRISLTEHSDQLYLTREDFESRRIIQEPDLPARMRKAGRDRYPAYRAFAQRFHSPFVRLGLELECDSEFKPILLEEDRAGWDLFLGGVHWMTEQMQERAGGGVERAFMKLTESLVFAGIDVLAHPFRYFVRKKLPNPVHLYRPVADLLAAHGVAAEINFHTNLPDPAFFAVCLERGVKIALGSDSHEPFEVGELGLHLDVLRQAGASEKDWANVLYQL